MNSCNTGLPKSEGQSPEKKASLWSRRERMLLVLAMLPGFTFLSVFLWRTASWVNEGNLRFTLFDDAMISMTYARTLAETGELIWFPGADKVQGFTNPLWTAYMALIHWVGLTGSDACLAISLTGIVLILGSAVLGALLVRRVLGTSSEALLCALATGATIPLLYPLVFWTLRGMEVGLLGFLLLLMAFGLIDFGNPSQAGKPSARSLLLTALAGAVGILTRMDFAAIASVFGFSYLLSANSLAERIRILLLVGVPMVSAIVALMLFQHSYYGDWLPNTYHLKVEGIAPLDRLRRGLFSFSKVIPMGMLIYIASLLILRTEMVLARKLAATLSCVVLMALCYSVWVGGDAWETLGLFNRYITIVLPAGVVIIFVSVGSVLQSPWKFSRPKLSEATLLILFIGLTYSVLIVSEAGVKAAILSGLLVSLLLMTWVYTSGLQLFQNRKSFAAVLLITCVSLGVLISTSASPGYTWIKDRGLHVNNDQIVTNKGLALRNITEPNAVIATTWAGAPAYYSHRKMIDLLGKSDRKIAKSKPKGSLIPGHNKWDYSYSIGQLRPDMLVHLWKPTELVVQQMEAWGYVPRCHPTLGQSYYLSESQQIRWSELAECPAAE